MAKNLNVVTPLGRFLIPTYSNRLVFVSFLKKKKKKKKKKKNSIVQTDAGSLSVSNCEIWMHREQQTKYTSVLSGKSAAGVPRVFCCPGIILVSSSWTEEHAPNNFLPDCTAFWIFHFQWQVRILRRGKMR